MSEEQTAALLSAFFAVSRRLKRLVFLSRDGSNELDFISWCADLATTELSVFALSYLFSRVLRKQFVPALNLRTVAAKLRLDAEAGDRDTQFLLSQVLLSGIGVEKDEGEAIKWMLRAADRNLVKAQGAYGRSLLIGQYGLKKDVEKAMAYLQRAAIAGDSESQTVLGLCYTSRTFPTEHENAEGVRLFTMAAESGHAVAQCKLGHCYLSGRGGIVSEEKAIEWYTKAAEAGLAEAQAALGGLLAQHGEKDRAEIWLQKAASQGSLDAEAQLQALKNGSCIVS